MGMRKTDAKLDYTFSKLSAPPSNPQTGLLFTSLYGLYPCNFLKFLHKPYAYFEEYDFSIPEEFDEETFRARTIVSEMRTPEKKKERELHCLDFKSSNLHIGTSDTPYATSKSCHDGYRDGADRSLTMDENGVTRYHGANHESGSHKCCQSRRF